jgi:glutaredoxin
MKRLLLVAALLASTSGALAQFKWKDAAGGVHYGDNPPRDALELQRLGHSAPSGDDPLRGLPFELRRTASTYPVVLYTSEPCAPCAAARELLRARGVPYTERTISSREDLDQFQRLGHGSAVPVLTVGSQVQRMFQPQDWNRLLDAAGYPRSSQLPRNWRAPPPQPLVPKAAAPAAAGPDATEPAADARPTD